MWLELKPRLGKEDLFTECQEPKHGLGKSDHPGMKEESVFLRNWRISQVIHPATIFAT